MGRTRDGDVAHPGAGGRLTGLPGECPSSGVQWAAYSTGVRWCTRYGGPDNRVRSVAAFVAKRMRAHLY